MKMVKKYLDLKGNVFKTPYGIGVTVFISNELLDHVRKQELKKPEEEKITPAEIVDKQLGLA